MILQCLDGPDQPGRACNNPPNSLIVGKAPGRPRLLLAFRYGVFLDLQQRREQGAISCLDHVGIGMHPVGERPHLYHDLLQAFGIFDYRRIGFEAPGLAHKVLALGDQPDYLGIDPVDVGSHLAQGLAACAPRGARRSAIGWLAGIGRSGREGESNKEKRR
jgi:hypothetical protein